MANQPPTDHHFWNRPTAQPLPQAATRPYTPSHQPPQPPGGPFVPPSHIPPTSIPSTSPPPPSTAPLNLQNHPPPLQTPPISLFSSLPPKGSRIRLYNDKRDEEQNAEHYQDLSAVFSVITATERLENIWARRAAISREDYEMHCEHLIQQFHVFRNAVPKLDLFIAEYGVKASKARQRLVSGVPATVMQPGRGGAGAGRGREQGKFVLRCTSLFHHVSTCIDMDQVQVGMLLPDLTSLMKTLGRIQALNDDFVFGDRIRFWVEKLNGMQAAEELNAEDSAQLKLDLDNGYAEFEDAITD